MVFLTMVNEILMKGRGSSHCPPGSCAEYKEKGRAMSDPASFFPWPEDFSGPFSGLGRAHNEQIGNYFRGLLNGLFHGRGKLHGSIRHKPAGILRG
jgi:hypothetical protein